MKPHNLRWISTLADRDEGKPLRAECSCGQRWSGVPDEEAMYATHEDHLMSVDCDDHWHCDPGNAAHSCLAPDRMEPCPTCGEEVT